MILKFHKRCKLNKSSSFFDDITSPQNLDLKINQMTKWRFQSKEIVIKNNIWSAEVLYLTNDPFNNPQIIIKNSKFKSFEKNGNYVLNLNGVNNLEEKLKLPIGPRNYKSNKGNNFRWGLGYDKSSKDGIYISRTCRYNIK